MGLSGIYLRNLKRESRQLKSKFLILKIKCQGKFGFLVLIATSKKVVQQQYFEFYSC